MRIQKCYIGYCIATWLLWVTTLILTEISGGAFDIHNETLYYFNYKLYGVSLLLSWIPIHPVMFIISLIYSIKNKRAGYISFNGISIIISTMLAVAILGSYVWLIGGV